LLGNAPGVLDENHSVIPRITPDTVREVQKYLRGSGYRDVTGGMADKVKRMVGLVAQLPELRVRIMSGLTSGNLKSTLLDPAGSNEGTLICS
jgi:isopentenyl phosphate kinase